MAVEIQSNIESRFTDLCNEPIDHVLLPITDYQNQEIVSLKEAIEPICQLFDDIQDNAFIALFNCQNPTDGLDLQESASIHLYTMQFNNGPSLNQLLNQSLRSGNREELKPWFPFLNLFLTALHKLPSENKLVWRGVKNVDLNSKYETGTKFTWWGVSSCTTNFEVLESDELLGKTGQRTFFSIECINGKSILNHSCLKHIEKEVILMPGSYFEVINHADPEPELHIIHLKEIQPPISLTSQSKPKQQLFIPNLNIKEVWKRHGTTQAGGNEIGDHLNQLSSPWGVYIDDDQTIYVADSWNHRIVEWKSDATEGQIVVGANGRGSRDDQLNLPTKAIVDKENDALIICDRDNQRIVRWPRRNGQSGETLISNIDCWDVIIDNQGYLYVSDDKKHEVRRWKMGETNETGTLVAGGNGQGNHLDQLNCPYYIFVDEDQSVYVSDLGNHRVMKWMKDAKEGIVVAGGQGEGTDLKHLSHPQGIFVDQLGNIYIADFWNHRVLRWLREATAGTVVVGTSKEGHQSNRFSGPMDLSFDRHNSLYVVDWGNNRVQKFDVKLH